MGRLADTRQARRRERVDRELQRRTHAMRRQQRASVGMVPCGEHRWVTSDVALREADRLLDEAARCRVQYGKKASRMVRDLQDQARELKAAAAGAKKGKKAKKPKKIKTGGGTNDDGKAKSSGASQGNPITPQDGAGPRSAYVGWSSATGRITRGPAASGRKARRLAEQLRWKAHELRAGCEYADARDAEQLAQALEAGEHPRAVKLARDLLGRKAA